MNVKRVLGAGAAGTVVMTILMLAAPMIKRSTRQLGR